MGCSPFRLELRRLSFNKAIVGTLSLYRRLSSGDEILVASCDTLELSWKDNARNISCIPYGDYVVVQRTFGGYQKRYEERWGHPYSLEVAHVKGRGDILMHVGNTIKDTLGCILLGMRVDDAFIAQSRETYKRMWEHLDTAFVGSKEASILPPHIPLHICNGLADRFLKQEPNQPDFNPDERATMVL